MHFGLNLDDKDIFTGVEVANKLVEREFTTKTGLKIDVITWKVPESEDYRERLKYKFQAYDPETGKTMIR